LDFIAVPQHQQSNERTAMKKTQKANRPVQPRMTQPFTIEQVKALLNGAQGEMMTLILLGVTTGQRLRDLLALKWKDVDLAKGVITFHPVKTRRTDVMPLTPQSKEHLEQLPNAGPDALVLPGLGSRPAAVVSVKFGKLAKEVGIEGARFHSLRVTFICQLREAGLSQAVVAKVMGQVTPASEFVYSKPNTEALRAVIERFPPLK
jgi:integrase